ncbi:MAG: (2Fe-2S)-binding protein [Terracoccus sp.]
MTETDVSTVAEVVDAVDRALPFLTVTTHASPGTVSCSTLVERAATDPLAPWRAHLHAQQEAQSGGRVRRHVPAAFVLQWWCEVVATPITYAAELGPWSLLPEADGLGFELEPYGHPGRVVVDPARTVLDVDDDGDRRARRGRAAYEEIVGDVVRSFAPEVRMGSRQRWGVVEDVWVGTQRRAREAAGVAVGPERRRISCCFIYALPGAHECTACPRGARRTS